ncbi:MAG: hypothetical protein AB7K09_19890 [Planctomycetota bacterium]
MTREPDRVPAAAPADNAADWPTSPTINAAADNAAHNASNAPGTDATTSPPPPATGDDLPVINERSLADLRRVAPFTRPEAGDGRDPAHNARQLLLALADENPRRLRAALHPDNALHIDPADPGSWSIWRARLGRHLGLLGWGFPDPTRLELVCLLASPPDRAETTWLRMVPWHRTTGGDDSDNSGEDAAWRVQDAGVTLEPATICPADRMVYLRLDRTVAQPDLGRPEAVQREPLGPDLPDVIAGMVESARTGRDITARVITTDEWLDSSPPVLRRDVVPGPDLPQQLMRRLQHVARSGLDLAGCVVLSRYQIAGAPTVFARCLLVFGRADQVRRACLTEWRSVRGIFKLSALHFLPVPTTVDALLARTSR